MTSQEWDHKPGADLSPQGRQDSSVARLARTAVKGLLKPSYRTEPVDPEAITRNWKNGGERGMRAIDAIMKLYPEFVDGSFTPEQLRLEVIAVLEKRINNPPKPQK